MTAYLVWRGMTMEAIGIWRGVSSAAGLLGTFVYHLLSTRISLVDSGMCSILFQFSCLSLSYASLYVEDYKTSLGMLIAGVCASRVGLWVFDISVTQVRLFKKVVLRCLELLSLLMGFCIHSEILYTSAHAGTYSRRGPGTRWWGSTISECFLSLICFRIGDYNTRSSVLPHLRICWLCKRRDSSPLLRCRCLCKTKGIGVTSLVE